MAENAYYFASYSFCPFFCLQRDLGRPLICKIDGHYKLIGLVSWGSDHCEPESPTVYTQISVYKNWISTVITGKLWKMNFKNHNCNKYCASEGLIANCQTFMYFLGISSEETNAIMLLKA